jgi:hypothetical protein
MSRGSAQNNPWDAMSAAAASIKISMQVGDDMHRAVSRSGTTVRSFNT